jgi:hypothetical protein
MPFSLHRSLLFWAGVFVALSILFFWGACSFGVRLGKHGGRDVFMQSSYGAILIRSQQALSGTAPPISQFEFYSPVIHGPLNWSFDRPAPSCRVDRIQRPGRPATATSYAIPGSDVRRIDLTLPYWLILALFLIAWLPLLRHRARRQNAATAQTAPATPALTSPPGAAT